MRAECAAGSPLALVATALLCAAAVEAQELPVYLRDRGTGVATSMFGTYVRERELLVYPFFEWYHDANLEYKPSELGYAGDQDYRGRFRGSEALLFLGYGITRNVAVELEAAFMSAELRKSSEDPSAMPPVVRESGLGDVEGQLRWRFMTETPRRPEAFTYFETVFPLQKQGKLIGTSAWEHKLGVGMTRGYDWGTMTVRSAIEYSGEEKKFEAGEYAVEYLRRLSPAWRVVALIEGYQIDEIELITEAQWHFAPRAFLKVNTGIGVTPNATDFAPEIGIMFSF